MFDDQLLQAFIAGFYGFGDYHAPTWFVGLEEGGGATPDDLAGKFAPWAQRGHKVSVP